MTPSSYSFEDDDEFHFSSVFFRNPDELGCKASYDNTTSDPFNKAEITFIEFGVISTISGTFQFRLIDRFQDCIDTLEITDGRFDVNFQYIP